MATGAGRQQQQQQHQQQQQQQHPPAPPPPPPPSSGNPAAPNSCASGTSPSSASCNLLYESGLAMEYTHELHLKMSKKIAQLTKVCLIDYACSHSHHVSFVEPEYPRPRYKPINLTSSLHVLLLLLLLLYFPASYYGQYLSSCCLCICVYTAIMSVINHYIKVYQFNHYVML